MRHLASTLVCFLLLVTTAHGRDVGDQLQSLRDIEFGLYPLYEDAARRDYDARITTTIETMKSLFHAGLQESAEGADACAVWHSVIDLRDAWLRSDDPGRVMTAFELTYLVDSAVIVETTNQVAVTQRGLGGCWHGLLERNRIDNLAAWSAAERVMRANGYDFTPAVAFGMAEPLMPGEHWERYLDQFGMGLFAKYADGEISRDHTILGPKLIESEEGRSEHDSTAERGREPYGTPSTMLTFATAMRQQRSIEVLVAYFAHHVDDNRAARMGSVALETLFYNPGSLASEVPTGEEYVASEYATKYVWLSRRVEGELAADKFRSDQDVPPGKFERWHDRYYRPGYGKNIAKYIEQMGLPPDPWLPAAD